MSDAKPMVLVLVGATAVGKTELSLKVAKRFSGEIINADASAFYQGLDIGTAKPTVEEQTEIHHHLIDIAPPDVTITLGEFHALSYRAISDILQKSKFPIIVGGSGLFITSVVDNYAIPRVAPNPKFREALEVEAARVGRKAIHERLAELDPFSASKIDYRNLRRVIRALEIHESTGKPPSLIHKHSSPSYRFAILGLQRSREALFERIDIRIERMFQQGFVKEVEKLLNQGYSPDLPSMAAIGYRQVALHIQGELSLDEAKSQMRRLTRRLARQQDNWFKNRRSDVLWINANNPSLIELACAYVQNHLESKKSGSS